MLNLGCSGRDPTRTLSTCKEMGLQRRFRNFGGEAGAKLTKCASVRERTAPSSVCQRNGRLCCPSDHRTCLRRVRPRTCLLGWQKSCFGYGIAAVVCQVEKEKKKRGKQRCMSGRILPWHVSPPAAVCNQEENELLSTRLVFLPSVFFFFLSCRGLEVGTIDLAPLVQITLVWHGNCCFADLSALFFYLRLRFCNPVNTQIATTKAAASNLCFQFLSECLFSRSGAPWTPAHASTLYRRLSSMYR